MDDGAIAQSREDWLTGKVRMAFFFGVGAIDVRGYEEAIFILCAVFGAIASEPGRVDFQKDLFAQATSSPKRHALMLVLDLIKGKFGPE